MAQSFIDFIRAQCQDNQDVIAYRKKLTDVFKILSDEGVKQGYAEMRNLDDKVLEGYHLFLVPAEGQINNLPAVLKETRTDFLYENGAYKHAGRVILPIYDTEGLVMGFQSWNPDMKPKYLLSSPFGFKARHGNLLGLEIFDEAVKSNKPIIIVEGLVDLLRLRELGIYAFASMGSVLHGEQIDLLRPISRRLVFLVDPDSAGMDYARQVSRVLPEAVIYYINAESDIDSTIKQYYEEDYAKYESLIADLSKFCESRLILSSHLKMYKGGKR